MKLPRGVSGDRLIHILFGLGYSVIRQKGSQVRLRYEGPARPHANGSSSQFSEDRHSAWNPLGGGSGAVDYARVASQTALKSFSPRTECASLVGDGNPEAGTLRRR